LSLSTANPTSAPDLRPTADGQRWFAEEVQPCELSLRSYLRRSLPSAADVDDAVQNCYVRLWRAKQAGKVRTTKALLFTIARNAVRDFFTLRARTNLIPLTETAALPVLEGDRDMVEALCHAQELALLAEAIDSLPKTCREVILLRKIQGLPQREIAGLLGVPEHTVENLAVKGARLCADYLRARGVLPHAPRR
jgi:RNA polymerase sigma-70 factor (ECF subfamily)